MQCIAVTSSGYECLTPLHAGVLNRAQAMRNTHRVMTGFFLCPCSGQCWLTDLYAVNLVLSVTQAHSGTLACTLPELIHTQSGFVSINSVGCA